MSQKVQFKTADGMNIVGDFYKSDKKTGLAALLLHMMPATRSSWDHFAEQLAGTGISSLAIDLRGHGESQGGPEGFKSFTDQEHQASMKDVEAGIWWLRDAGFKKIVFAGASIGANLALWRLAEGSDEEIKSAILLSPGLDYRGIKTEPLAQKLLPDKNIFIISEMAGDAQKIYDLTRAKKQIKIIKERYHGTDILRAHPDIEKELMKWAAKNV